MGPKKAAAETKVSPLPSESPEKVDMGENKPEEPSKAAALRKALTHPSTMEMVKEALKELDSRKGVSVQAIRSFIKEKHPTVDETRLKVVLRKALVKGLESGTLVRPPNSNAVGAQGRFRLAVRKEAKPAKTKEAKENANPNVGKTKATGAETEKSKPAKKAKSADQPKKSKAGVTTSKVPPAKKPKAKQAAGEEMQKPKAQKASKTSKSEGAESAKPAKKGGKKEAQKAEGVGNAGAAAAPKKGKKAGKKASGDGEEEATTTASKTSGKKGKKTAEK